jgi:Tfp pilus assembly protein PilO
MLDERRMQRLTWVLAAILGLAAGAAGTRAYIGPALGWRERVARLRADAVAEQRVLATGAALAAATAALDSALIEGAARVPAEARLDAFVAEAGRSARAHRVRIAALQPGEVVLEGERRFLPVQVVVEGDFRQIYAWMVALESGSRLVRVDRLRASLQSGAAVRAELRAQLFLSGAPTAGS